MTGTGATTATSAKRVRRIVIVGGGIAGLSLATKLGTRLGRTKKAEVTLIDKNAAHVWKPMLHTFAAGTSHVYQEKIPFLAHASQHGFRYVLGALADIDRNARTVALDPLVSDEGETILHRRLINYDVLILAAGSRANDFGTPGVAEFCRFIDDINEAQSFNDRLYDDLLRTAEYGGALRIAIVGGGATGVELAAEISQLLELIRNYGGDLRPRLDLTLIEAGPRILASFPETVATAATRQLRDLGITVLTDAQVVGADEDGFALADGTRVEAKLRVWAAGVKAPAAFAHLSGFEQTRTGQIVTNPTFQTTTDEYVFAVGDCASLRLDGAERPLPPTAQVARQQAAHLGRHLPAWIEGTEIPPFVFRDFGSLVSLSKYNAFGTLARRGFFRGGFIEGRFAQLSHAMLYRMHQAELHGAPRAALLWLSGRIAALVRPSVRID
jgi:NADH dehydrogenase